jgi:hypothetical protein
MPGRRDALKPWQHRSWIFPRDPYFAIKAARMLDLYQRTWDGQPLGDDEYVLSADEKPGVQARRRIHHRHQAVHRPGGPGDERRALCLGETRLLGRRQRGIAPQLGATPSACSTSPGQPR